MSQGRLLRGSSMGRLLVERDRYFVGDTVVVRAQLSTASREPYIADRVMARVTQPIGGDANAAKIGSIGKILISVVFAVFFTMLLVTANTMAQSVRERTNEIGVLRHSGSARVRFCGSCSVKPCS